MTDRPADQAAPPTQTVPPPIASSVAPPPGLEIDFVRQFMTQRQGRWFVAYPGLLHLAHQKGLVGIETNVLQFPEDSNGYTCVVRADVRLEQQGRALTFADIGDASPKNVSSAIAPHLMRMASTRAKARALRDAVNIGYTTLEELADDDGPASRGGQSGPPREGRPPQANGYKPPVKPPAKSPNDGAPNDDIPLDYGNWPPVDEHPFDARVPGGDAVGQEPADESVVVEKAGNEYRAKYKGMEWTAPKVVVDLSNSDREAYASWARQILSATSVGQLQELFPRLEPMARAKSESLGDHVKVMFTDRRKLLQSKSNGRTPSSN